MARYRKIDPRIWNDAKFRDLDDQGKLVFLMLLTHPHMTAIGAMRANAPGLTGEIGWHEKPFREAFAEVLAKGMAEYDERASMIWLPRFLKYNPPESPNVVKAWANSLDLLPECNLKLKVIHEAKDFACGLTEGFGKALPEAFSKAMPIQEQEQEQEQEQDKTTGPQKRPAGKTSKAKPKEPPGFAEVKTIYPPRRGSQRWADALNHYRARLKEDHTHEQIMDGIRRYARFCKIEGRLGTDKVQQAATFLGTNKGFMEPWATGGATDLDAEKHKANILALAKMFHMEQLPDQPWEEFEAAVNETNNRRLARLGRSAAMRS